MADLSEADRKVVATFKELNEKLAVLDALRSDNNASLTTNEESDVRRAFDDFRKRMKSYEHRQGTHGVIEDINGMKKDINKWSKKLNTVFDQNNLGQV